MPYLDNSKYLSQDNNKKIEDGRARSDAKTKIKKAGRMLSRSEKPAPFSCFILILPGSPKPVRPGPGGIVQNNPSFFLRT